MDLAGYEPRRRLRIEHDPLHPENCEALGQYLKYCWQIIVRCDMMAREIGMDIPWHDVISECLVQMLDSRGFRSHGTGLSRITIPAVGVMSFRNCAGILTKCSFSAAICLARVEATEAKLGPENITSASSVLSLDG
jgi:hypothetical protein